MGIIGGVIIALSLIAILVSVRVLLEAGSEADHHEAEQRAKGDY